MVGELSELVGGVGADCPPGELTETVTVVVGEGIFSCERRLWSRRDVHAEYSAGVDLESAHRTAERFKGVAFLFGRDVCLEHVGGDRGDLLVAARGAFRDAEVSEGWRCGRTMRLHSFRGPESGCAGVLLGLREQFAGSAFGAQPDLGRHPGFRLRRRVPDTHRWRTAHAYAELARRGWSTRQIGAACGVNASTVSRAVRVALRYRNSDDRPTFWHAYSEVTGENRLGPLMSSETPEWATPQDLFDGSAGLRNPG